MKAYIKLIEEADSYAQMVARSFRNKKFDNKFILSLATISFEKFMVACLIFHDDLPNGHTLSFLINELSKYTKIDPSIIKLLAALDEKIQLCSIEKAIPYIPTDNEMQSILSALEQIQSIVKEETRSNEAL